MTYQLDQLQEKLNKLENMPLIVLHPDNLDIFPNGTKSYSPVHIIAEILINCTMSFLLELQGGKGQFGDQLELYDEEVLSFARNSSCADFIRYGNRKDNSSAKKFIRYISGFPEPPKLECMQRLQLLHKFMQKVVKLSELTENEIMYKLFGLCTSWLHEQRSLDSWNIPVDKLLVSAKHHIRRNAQRIHNNHERHCSWGKEYHNYFKKYLEQGFCTRTAHGKARKDFMANHPLNDETSQDSSLPGHSRPALKRYHNTYL